MKTIGTKARIQRLTYIPIPMAANTQNKQSIIHVKLKAYSLSIAFMSFENQLVICPEGVISKYVLIGALSTLLTI